MNKVIALKLVGGLSDTSKMPGKSFGLPTSNCKIGAKLAKIPGSVCNKCYANKGHYVIWPKILAAQKRRLDFLDHPQWIEAMIKSLEKENWFRWFDSGDLQSTQMLLAISEVARGTPHCKHWLATRERAFVREFLRTNKVPSNLCIRISATFPDIPVKPLSGVQQANVHKNEPPVGFECKAPSQHGKCEQCRACWNKRVQTVSYKEH